MSTKNDGGAADQRKQLKEWVFFHSDLASALLEIDSEDKQALEIKQMCAELNKQADALLEARKKGE